MEDGFIKLYRKILYSAVFSSPNLLQVWLYCLLRASYTSRNFKFNDAEMKLSPGQFICGRKKGAYECNMREGTFRDQLKTLKKMGNITIKTTNKFSIITVCEWGTYQFTDEKSDSKNDNKPTTNRHIQEGKNIGRPKYRSIQEGENNLE